jgi:ABC-type sugar transport system ATPase subunit
MKEEFSDKSFLYISHNVLEVSRFCDEILVLRTSLKTPQLVIIKGQDLAAGQGLDEKSLELSMLEIVHAA